MAAGKKNFHKKLQSIPLIEEEQYIEDNDFSDIEEEYIDFDVETLEEQIKDWCDCTCPYYDDGIPCPTDGYCYRLLLGMKRQLGILKQ